MAETGAPHEVADLPLVTSRRGHFWVGIERVPTPGGTVARGPMFVQWEAPERVTRPLPIVLVHGGGGQGTDWLGTPDGRAGWATHLVQDGWAVYVVDRPGHGRSPHHPDVLGPMGPPFPYEAGLAIFAPPGAEGHTRWPGDPGVEDPALNQFVAGAGPMLADLGAGQELDADRGAELLDRIGPAVVVTHSASGPAGWLIAERRPGLVRALVAIEPLGPPFAETPVGTLTEGLTAAPLPSGVAGLAGIPIAVVASEASVSPLAGAAPAVVEHLRGAGVDAELLVLADHGAPGHGHGMMWERDNRAALQPILDWLEGVLA